MGPSLFTAPPALLAGVCGILTAEMASASPGNHTSSQQGQATTSAPSLPGQASHSALSGLYGAEHRAVKLCTVWGRALPGSGGAGSRWARCSSRCAARAPPAQP